MNTNLVKHINSIKFDKLVTKLRSFCKQQEFIETFTQNKLSILSTCEDPKTISIFNYAGNTYPLPQTGQMWLEHELLSNPSSKGYFTLSTSYRNEPNPTSNRYDLIFPMFEFELHGDMETLIDFEKKILLYLGFKPPFYQKNYLDMLNKYQVHKINHEHELALQRDYGPVVFLKNFPINTNPFWNMKFDDNTNIAKKVDIILHGIETIGSAERSTNKDQMKKSFFEISNGEYIDILYSNFNKKRVNDELDEFLSYNFFPRVGGGIGITRLLRAMELEKLL